jgi:hypothetical protein
LKNALGEIGCSEIAISEILKWYAAT